MTTYKVQKGDTLSKIANKYNVTVSDIQKANSKLIKNVNNISVGWVLTIPTKTTTTATATPTKDYSKIGKQLETCIKDIENLASFKKLEKMM